MDQDADPALSRPALPMYYFEHYLRAAGLDALRRAVVLRVPDGEWVLDDLRAELQDVHPEADVSWVDPTDTRSAELLIVPLTSPAAFPFHDVLYDHLVDLEAARPLLARADFVMVYRVRWREVEVFRTSAWPAWRRRRRLESRAIRLLCGTSRFPRLFAPRYPS